MPEIYYPSCSYARLDPQSARRLRAWCRDRGMDVAGCCHYDRREPSPEDVAIYFCQACRQVEEGKGFASRSLWETLDCGPVFVPPRHDGLHVTLQDCWRDREKPEIHDAVRSLLAKMGVTWEELPHARGESDFCGTLHFETRRYAGEVSTSDHLGRLGGDWPRLLMEEQVSYYPTKRALCYCCRCHDGILLGGGHPVHLMTLLMDGWRGREDELEAHVRDLLSRPDPRMRRTTPSA